MKTMKDDPNCKHESMRPPDFDPVETAKMNINEVRLKFPRYQGTCPACEKFLTIYASDAHKLAGAW